jgi:hypothetical protein
LTIVVWEHPTNSSRVGIFDTAGIAVNTAGSASRVVRSTDHIVANTANTADIADTAFHPNTDHSKGHMPVPEGRGRPRQAKPAVQLPRKTFSSDYPPLRVRRMKATK